MAVAELPVVKIEEFEGPFDLLLELVRVKKLDIFRVSLSEVTEDFLEAVQTGAALSAEQQAEFASTAALLLVMKLKSLIPDLDESEEDQADDLSWRVRVYALYRDQAKVWREQWGERPLLPGPLHLKVQAEAVWPETNASDLAAAFRRVLNKLPAPLDKRRHLRPQGKRVQECLDVIRRYLADKQQVFFSEVVKDENRMTVATSLLAALEMAKNNQASCTQSDLFGEIEIKAVKS